MYKISCVDCPSGALYYVINIFPSCALYYVINIFAEYSIFAATFFFQNQNGIETRTGAYVYHFDNTGHVVNSLFQRLDKNTQEKQDDSIAELVKVMTGNYTCICMTYKSNAINHQ